MRKLMGLTVMALAVTVPAFAQERLFVPDISCDKPYVVKGGDTLWNLSELKLRNPTLWSWVAEQNPILLEEGRMFVRADGLELVRIYPGEELYCLEEAGLIQSDETGNTIVVPPSLSVPASEKTFIDFLGDWWWLLALVGLAALAVWWLNRELKKDPVNSGPPQVPGGVNSVVAARTRFESRADQEHFTILNVTPGTIYGTMMVKYGDGTERPRTLNGERAYQATVRRNDGQVENIYMLMACGNDLRFGGIARYIPGPDFRFQPDGVETPAPIVAPASEVSSVADTSTSASTGKPELKIELKPGEREGETSMVRVTGAPTESMVITVTDDSFTLRFHPPKKD